MTVNTDAQTPATVVGFQVVAIGASAGGIPALRRVTGALPRTLTAAVLIVQHLDPKHRSMLREVLERSALLPVRVAADGVPVQPGTVYVGVPDLHFLVVDRHIELTRLDLVNYSRPSVDVLFESVAKAYGAAAIGVVLTGTGADGAMGIRAIKRAGGTTIAEDPRLAAHPGMPQAAVATRCIDMILPLEQVGPAIAGLVAGGTTSPSAG